MGSGSVRPAADRSGMTNEKEAMRISPILVIPDRTACGGTEPESTRRSIA